jgi:dephospho-CoA kinase
LLTILGEIKTLEEKKMTIVLYLIGRSGSGKYTIAKQLEKYEFKIVDNHLINNPIFSLLDLNDGVPIPDLAREFTAQIRSSVFNFISKEHKHNYVLTNELLEDEVHYKVFAQAQEMAERRGSLFVPIRLHLSKEENARRIQMPERALRFKAAQIDERAYQHSLIPVSHPNLMDIDINHLAAEAVAQKIMEATQQFLKTPSVSS